MKIPSISLSTSKNLLGMKKAFTRYCSTADELMSKKSNVTGMLPNSVKKSSTTRLTTPQLIDLILRNL